MASADISAVKDFSLVKGGPLYWLMIAMRLIHRGSYKRMAAGFALLTWLPLYLFSVLDGAAEGTSVRMPFLLDFATHARFLVALPLMILADGLMDPRVEATTRQVLRSGLVAEYDRPRFQELTQRLEKWRDSFVVEAGIALVTVLHTAIALGKRGWISTDVSTWYAQSLPQGPALTLAGKWLLLGLPIFTFFLYRWLVRLGVWAWFLYRLSRLELTLAPMHPDHTAGLAFVGKFHRQFGYVVLANSAVASGLCANWITFQGETLHTLKATIAVYLLLILALFLSPILLLTPALLRAKSKALADYGALSNVYIRSFHSKWLKAGGSTPVEPAELLGTADIQSLADLQNSFATVRDMNVVVMNRKGIMVMAAAAVAPFLPLLLTVYPLDELLARALKMLL